MASSHHRGSESGSDTDELEELECEIQEMAEKIREYRATLPEKLKNTLPSIIAAQRPVFADGLEPGASGAPNLGTLFAKGVYFRSEMVLLVLCNFAFLGSLLKLRTSLD